MNDSDNIINDLGEEQSLFAVYRKSFTYSQNRFDLSIRMLICTVLIVISASVWFTDRDYFPHLAKAVGVWGGLGFTYTATILGFLVSGFTIFSTMTKTEIFVALSRKIHSSEKVTQLKFIFYSFLRVFIFHISFLFLCVIVEMTRNIAVLLLTVVDQNSLTQVKKIAVTLVTPIMGYLFISTLLHLKTFVWNLYQSVVIAIAGSVALHELQQAFKAAAPPVMAQPRSNLAQPPTHLP